MKKRILAVLMVAVVATCMAACGSSDSGKTNSSASNAETSQAEKPDKVYEWSLGSMYNDPEAVPDFNGFGWGIKKFCDLVNEKTNGQVVITPYWSGVLGGDVELFDMVRNGELDVYYGSPMSNVDSRFAISKIPYLFKDFDQVKEMYASEGAPLFDIMHDVVSDYNCELLSVGTGTFRGFINSKKEVHHVSDIKDLTVRSYEDYIVNAFWSKICNATIMPYSECYTGFQTKAIDGGEFAETIVIQAKFYEVCKNFTDLDWQWVGHMTMVSEDKWNELPDELKEIVNECAWEAMAYEYEIEEQDRAKAYQAMEDNGMTVVRLTDEERQEWMDYARTQDNTIKDEIGEDVFNNVMQLAEETR